MKIVTKSLAIRKDEDFEGMIRRRFMPKMRLAFEGHGGEMDDALKLEIYSLAYEEVYIVTSTTSYYVDIFNPHTIKFKKWGKVARDRGGMERAHMETSGTVASYAPHWSKVYVNHGAKSS